MNAHSALLKNFVVSAGSTTAMVATLVASLVLGTGCTNDKTSMQLKGSDAVSAKALGPAPVGAASAGTVSGSSAPGAVASSTPTQESCSADDLAHFDRAEGEPIDLERETLPRGLYLATVSAMLIEKKNEGSAPTRVLVQEAAGGKGEITCAENLDKLGDDFEITVSGLVKFQTVDKPQGSGFISRQFYFYQDKNGYGAVLSNPHLSGIAAKQDAELKSLLKNGGQLFRLNEKSYLLRYLREREGVRARLLVRLEMIPR